MDRREIQQHVFDALGTILIDKEPIQSTALLSSLVLDVDDLAKFFETLENDHRIDIPLPIRHDLAETFNTSSYSQLTLEGLVDLILFHMKSGTAD